MNHRLNRIAFTVYSDGKFISDHDRPDEAIKSAENTKFESYVTVWEIIYTDKCTKIYLKTPEKTECHEQFRKFLA